MERAPDAFRNRIEDAIERDDADELADLVHEVGLVAEPLEWAQSCCLQLARHHRASVRASAVSALGHLARRFGHLDPGRARRVVQVALYDVCPLVRQRAADAADDLYTFLGWEFERPDAVASQVRR
jgi:HEAT repeat protein